MRTDVDTIYIGKKWVTTLSTSRIEIRVTIEHEHRDHIRGSAS
jgi:hypothetical protein